VELRILKDLRADDFGQNRAKRGVCLEVRILKGISGRCAEARDPWAEQKEARISARPERVGGCEELR